jgi:hypothetical protein
MTKHVKEPPEAIRSRRVGAGRDSSERPDLIEVIDDILARAKTRRQHWPDGTTDRWLAESREDRFP